MFLQSFLRKKIRKYILVSFIPLFFSCLPSRQTRAIRPLIIVEKNVVYTDPKTAEYKLVDSQGVKFIVYDKASLANVGDTIR
jgi:hypothetical protein